MKYRSRKNRKRALIHKRVFITSAVSGGHQRRPKPAIMQIGNRIGLPKFGAEDLAVMSILSMMGRGRKQ